MALTELETVLQIKDPLHGYIGLTSLEKSILDLRHTQRLRNIRSPAGIRLAYPGADTSLLGHMLGVMHVTGLFIKYLGGDTEEIEKARLASMMFTLARGPWANVMEEYLCTRGLDRAGFAEKIVKETIIREKLESSAYSPNEVADLVKKGVSLKGIRINLLETPVNPELIDSLERDSYFTGVDYAQLEFHRLFTTTRVAKNKIAVERGSRYTLDSYLSAAVNMFDAVYYHKTARAPELMLLRILDTAASSFMSSPFEKFEEFFLYDDHTFHDLLLSIPQDASEELRTGNRIYSDFNKRYLIKLAGERAISDTAFLNRLMNPQGLFEIETELAEDSDIDPGNVYVDYPNRPSVSYYPGKLNIDDLVLFERGSKGYEFWPVTEVSLLARSLGREMKQVRVYTTRGYRTRVKKAADKLLESVDTSGTIG